MNISSLSQAWHVQWKWDFLPGCRLWERSRRNETREIREWGSDNRSSRDIERTSAFTLSKKKKKRKLWLAEFKQRVTQCDMYTLPVESSYFGFMKSFIYTVKFLDLHACVLKSLFSCVWVCDHVDSPWDSLSENTGVVLHAFL